MAIPVVRTIEPNEVREMGRVSILGAGDAFCDIQRRSYAKFLQSGIAAKDRTPVGLEGILREVFPIRSFDGSVSLEYDGYFLGRPRYSIDECKQLRLTYGMPLRISLRLVANGIIAEDVYLGDVPIMIGGGQFIINGAERVVVSQLHRSPGVDFVAAGDGLDRRQFSCRIIPERGSWVEFGVSRREGLTVRIDQSGRFPATMLLRAMSSDLGSNSQIVRKFYRVTSCKVAEAIGKRTANDLIFPAGTEHAGEVICDIGDVIDSDVVDKCKDAGLVTTDIIVGPVDEAILNTLRDDPSGGHEDALLRIYQRLRPGNPPSLDRARELFHERFHDVNRYRLGVVGRFRINRKFSQGVPEEEMALVTDDVVNCIKYMLLLRAGDESARVDDIDNLGNRRLRTVDELATEEIRKGLLKLRRTVQERLAVRDVAELTPRTLVNPKSVSAAIDFFFGRSELSQVVDQTNPLSMLTHERRLSALGPGGLNRKRAGFEVRDVHISHYGRICPIETPEGTNIGLISSLAIFAQVDDYGFLTTPYYPVDNGVIGSDVVYLRADEETDARVAPADVEVDQGELVPAQVLVRYRSDVRLVSKADVTHMDCSPAQMVGVSASLIPFLEHDDANRALMGSNMQRQAVPLLISERPLVGTGMESVVASQSGMVVRAAGAGTVSYVDASKVVIGDAVYQLRKFQSLNERTCINQRPIVSVGDRVKSGDILTDSAATSGGELALGRNVLVAFMSWEGYNFEDAIILSERLVRDDVYTSIHIDEFDVEIRETKLGREEFTRDIPNVGERALRYLDSDGVVVTGTRVAPGDILVGKISPKAKSELTPEEKLLHAIFGRAGEDVKNESLEVPSGVAGVVIGSARFSRRMALNDVERKQLDEDAEKARQEASTVVADAFRTFVDGLEKLASDQAKERIQSLVRGKADDSVAESARDIGKLVDDVLHKSPGRSASIRKYVETESRLVERAIDTADRMAAPYTTGEELQNGVLKLIKIYVASKRAISVGDKMAGRHGNKGVISKILPIEDMPYLDDGTPVDMILNPLGVPSRMNVGQILETHLGWAASKVGVRFRCPVFSGPDLNSISEIMRSAGLPEDGKIRLRDGRSGESFEQATTVGYIYMLKLHHLVDDKIHARATGPYSLITQQPLGGKARFGGQRFGEMEVWALEAYGASHILQELLTVKSDDVEGRTKIYESMVKGENTLEAGTPASFDVLTNEIRGLGLNLRLEKA